ncbi:MAG TPA: hypothetical protein VGY48_29590 [Vicinamibacterales bacterium]|nr:hypothetical protein [Vicinamibacterales bacterium]
MAADALGRLTRRSGAAVLLLSLARLTTSCSASPPAPSAPILAPTGPVVNIAGTWTGTFASANFPTRTITLMVYQTTNCVDGAWHSASSDWAGAISGYAGTTSYAGQFSFERTSAAGGQCSAAGNMSGPVTGNTLHWTTAGLTAVGACAGEVPQSIVIDLQRQ